MADTDPSPEEALTKEEIQSSATEPPAGEKRKNACTVVPPHSHPSAPSWL